MGAAAEIPIRLAQATDAPTVARMLHEFGAEFDDPTPTVERLTEVLGRLIADGELTALLAAGGPDGLATLRFRPAVINQGIDAYLEELYVAPARRGHGIGRALLEAAMDAARERGAKHIDLNTSEEDTAALALYESAGFTSREGAPDGPRMLYYERDL